MSRGLRLLALSSALAVAELSISTAWAQEPEAPPAGPDLIVLSGTARVPRGSTVGEVVVLRGRAVIEGVAVGDVIVLDGPITVNGQVSGSVIAVTGVVRLGPGAQVGGEVRARGTVRTAAGAHVAGGIRQRTAFTWRGPVEVFGRFAGWLAVTVSTFLLGLLLVLMVPRALDTMSATARAAPWWSSGWGLALAIALPIAVLLLAVSLVGLPLALALLSGFGLLGLLGYVIVMYLVGRLLWPSPRSRAVAFVFGWLILRAVGAVPYLSGATAGLAAVFGLGVGAVALWRARSVGGKHREGKAVVWTEAMREEAGL